MNGGQSAAREGACDITISIRQYIIQEDGGLRRVPRRIRSSLPFGTDAIPTYAGTRQRVAQVVIEYGDRKPLQILDVIGHFWDFDAEGKIDASVRESLRDWMEVAHDNPAQRREATVVDLVPDLKRRELREKQRWRPTSDDIDLIAADIWPGITGPAPDVETVKGKAPRRPPLSAAAKHVLNEIGRDLSVLQSRLSDLTEHDLKGLAFEAARMGSFEDEALSNAVAGEAKRQLAAGSWLIGASAVTGLRLQPAGTPLAAPLFAGRSPEATMKPIITALTAIALCAALGSTTAQAGRAGSHRVGGHGPHGKGSHYVGGHRSTAVGRFMHRHL